eukprot:scaffold57345_cov60-Phaeocystis_antarctica.AAC.2
MEHVELRSHVLAAFLRARTARAARTRRLGLGRSVRVAVGDVGAHPLGRRRSTHLLLLRVRRAALRRAVGCCCGRGAPLEREHDLLDPLLAHEVLQLAEEGRLVVRAVRVA